MGKLECVANFYVEAVMVYPGFKYETDVAADGTVTLKLPLPHRMWVEIVVLAPEVDGFSV